MKKHLSIRSPEFWISALGLAVLAALYVYWLCSSPGLSLAGCLSALLCLVLFALVCLRFVPGWMDFWRPGRADSPRLEADPAGIVWRIFIALFGADVMMLLMVHALRVLLGNSGSFFEGLSFWTCLDSAHYLDIARDWYLSEGVIDRLVQLVFLPGYPLAVRLGEFFTGSYLYSALLVSALSFALSGCVFYKLLRLDFSNDQALRCLKYLCIMPGSFFFAAPMSESLFLLMCLMCLYCARRGKWLLGCAFGAYAAFTRSLGLMLFVPLLFELIHQLSKKQVRPGRFTLRLGCIFLVPLGFGAYCLVNYLVSGDPFKFLEYQAGHWGQRMGFFFNTASYQLDNAISAAGNNTPYFFGLWLPNLLSIFASLVLMLLCAKQLRPSYTAWFIAYFVVAIGATWLLSAPRYMVALPVIPMALSLCSSKRINTALTAICLILNLLYMLAFALRWQVW